MKLPPSLSEGKFELLAYCLHLSNPLQCPQMHRDLGVDLALLMPPAHRILGRTAVRQKSLISNIAQVEVKQLCHTNSNVEPTTITLTDLTSSQSQLTLQLYFWHSDICLKVEVQNRLSTIIVISQAFPPFQRLKEGLHF